MINEESKKTPRSRFRKKFVAIPKKEVVEKDIPVSFRHRK